MSSNKRYKQQSENNHRFQDIPPRFKRQKSLTSQKLQSAMESADQNSHPSQRSKHSWGDSSHGSFNGQRGPQVPREGRKIVKKLSCQKAQQNAENSLQKPSTQPFVLSPMENKLFSLVRDDECQNPQFSATHNHNYPSSSSPYVQPAAPLCDSISNNSNLHHRVTVTNQPDPYGWVEQNQNINHFNTLDQRCSPSPSVSSHRSANNKSPNTNIDISDPDIRTIEMLRELERVADQTDVGGEENSNVSHHLRMLMCAMDRYTEGVEDNVTNNTRDKVSPVETSRYIPNPPQIQIKDISQYQDFSDTDSAFSEDFSSPSKPVNQFAAPPNPGKLNTWNPWATPSFNALDVYAVTSPNANHHRNNNYNMHFVSHPSMFMYDYNTMYNARDSF